MKDDVTEQNINEQGRFDDLMETLDKEKGVVFLKKVTGKDVKRMFVMASISSIIRRFILDATDRAKIIFAYQNEGAILDENIPEEGPEESSGEEQGGEQQSEKPQNEDDNKLTDQEKRDAVRNLVMKDLRGIQGMPPSAEVVDAFFKIINIQSLPHLDGIAIDLYKVFDELFARKTVNWIDKHVDSGTLLVRYEVYLKKLYYLLNGTEVPAREGETKVTLKDAIRQFNCLRDLRVRSGEKYQKLASYLTNIIQNRNTQDGNGAHYSMFMNEEQLDRNIKEIVTMYMYITGQCLDKLKEKYESLNQ